MPFKVPEVWVWTTLGEILELVSGQDFPPEKYNANIAGIPYIIGASNIENEQLIINRWTESPSVYSYLNDLLVVCKGAGVGKMAINNIGVAHIARQIQAVRGYTNYTDIKYIKAVVKNNIENIISKANGLIPGLKRELLLSLQLPLPPISEQRRIVCEIERWFFLIDQIEQGKADLQTVIKQAKSKILDLAIHGKLVPQNPNDEPAIELLKRINPDFTPCDNRHSGKLPYEIPKTWVWCSHNSILDISGGSQPAKSYFETILKPNYIRLYQIRDYGESPVPVYIPINLASKQTKKGDILLARYGGSLGKVFYAEQGAYNVAMAKVIFKFENLIYKEFAYYYYLSDLYQGKLKEISRTAQTGFNITDFNDMYFPLPPINEQQRIVQKMEELFSSLDDIQKNLEV
ncbi:type I restriction modification DNA specificity domain protein [Bacteroides ovatus SD CMC 3f]|uniref:Restriction endonuclease subunit S n=1 Tax=Bacteroides ovatus TaxID=28116 RepID=A0A642ASR7_BACOV|nr:restriction endonuclease subunit S [Bacteroides ovatus]EFF54354.1 type I restriction modification DNA specificity domain protein [Bacteroides ovatus SD CMC 3f]KAA4578418.1 restriction endonuclease subunit S [Bacteroides ovatus]KAA4580425.1 restriction endonuclease subunit S [Bacteroides ovatus]KAA4587151.1 restriction endonuclease subunit S [Bacteroides ovatus]KAA4602327.1 restriction endonuclease subunit S [Bacteroides ovatus]